MAHLFFSAAHKSSGKTTLTVGLAAAMAARGLRVQCFKKGPDFIDPLWLARASGHACYNLDFNTQSRGEIRMLFAAHNRAADISLIEANKGLFDGVALDGGDSNAALASLLGAPVVLIIDVKGITRGLAPLLLGYQAFGRELDFAGVILNKVGGARHEAKLRAVVERYTDLPVLGAIGFDEAMLAPERHLGLMPPNESGAAEGKIAALCEVVQRGTEIDALLEIAARAVAPPPPQPPADAGGALAGPAVRIGVARDAAFGFYYADDLEALTAAGAELVFFDALQDARLPDMDGLFLGGGFPEMRMAQLQANSALRAEIRAAGEAGLPIYAECGGLMYLARRIRWKGEEAQMVGLIPGDVQMHSHPQGRGLVQLRPTAHLPWSATGSAGQGGQGEPLIRAHEFHHASLENLPEKARFAFDVLRGVGIGGGKDGFVIHNVLAGFAHLRATEQSPWARGFVDFVRRQKEHAAAGCAGDSAGC